MPNELRLDAVTIYSGDVAAYLSRLGMDVLGVDAVDISEVNYIDDPDTDAVIATGVIRRRGD